MSDWTLDRTFDSPSGEVRWDVLGPEHAPPVVLVHGTPFSSYVWRGIARGLAQAHRVYVWDLPGYGASAQYAGQDVSLGAQGRVLAELLGHWGLTEPAVAAHDFGGCVALRAHLLHGARYRRLALVDPVALSPWGSPAYRLLGGRAEVFGELSPDLHRALVREYVGSASHRGCTRRCWTGSSPLVQRGRTARVLPADHPERPAVHRRDPAPLRGAGAARAGVLGRGGHLDPGGPRP